MNNQEYEQKKRECWDALYNELLKGEVQWQPVSRKEIFNFAFDRAYALGKQEKDTEDTVTINKEEYDKLCKYRRYAANWYWNFTTCPECGEFNPRGYICANCDNDKN